MGSAFKISENTAWNTAAKAAKMGEDCGEINSMVLGLVDRRGFGPRTSSMQNWRSTVELSAHVTRPPTSNTPNSLLLIIWQLTSKPYKCHPCPADFPPSSFCRSSSPAARYILKSKSPRRCNSKKLKF